MVCFVDWIANYPVDSVIRPSNNWGQLYCTVPMVTCCIKRMAKTSLPMIGHLCDTITVESYDKEW